MNENDSHYMLSNREMAWIGAAIARIVLPRGS
jgi:hypothetical protein